MEAHAFHATLPKLARQAAPPADTPLRYDGHMQPPPFKHAASEGTLSRVRGKAPRIIPGITVRTGSYQAQAPLPCSPLTNTEFGPRRVWARGGPLQAASPAFAPEQQPRDSDGPDSNSPVAAHHSAASSPLASPTRRRPGFGGGGHGGARPSRGTGVQGGYSHTLPHQHSWRGKDPGAAAAVHTTPRRRDQQRRDVGTTSRPRAANNRTARGRGSPAGNQVGEHRSSGRGVPQHRLRAPHAQSTNKARESGLSPLTPRRWEARERRGQTNEPTALVSHMHHTHASCSAKWGHGVAQGLTRTLWTHTMTGRLYGEGG